MFKPIYFIAITLNNPNLESDYLYIEVNFYNIKLY